MSKITLAMEQFDMEGYISDYVGEVLGYVDNYQQIRTYCPFCEDRDEKGKLYVHLVSKIVFCQRCHYGRGIRLPKFISDVENISYREAIEKILESVSRSFGDMGTLVQRLTVPEEVKEVKETSNARAIELPPHSIELFSSDRGMLVRKAEKYVLDRKISKKQIKKHRFFLGTVGEYRQRLIIPVYFSKQLVHWVARDILNREGVVKYRTPPGVDQSLWLFNWDNVRNGKMVVVVEGVFDTFSVERAGFPVVASFGKGLSRTQVRLLQRFEDVVLMYDSDALAFAYDAAAEVGEHARVASIPEGDPDDLARREIRAVVNKAPGINSPDAMTQLFMSL